ncbi:hypothetical protein BC938DRAFT_481282 [Jimgerdemannia flammicorona]|uniref:F-box domain-containing protein n=1 Tax=Jimgerdemannia flammicorona TaxID=994334 RepID=A0A433QGI9_9FUNG|nr:hypothetical protein BC938DRAFT_481282 [Jimgerdemannia flammicorona]
MENTQGTINHSNLSSVVCQHALMKKFPVLPPELVHEILGYLKDDPSGSGTIDLIACSLVSITWYQQARLLLGENPFEPLTKARVPREYDLVRAVELLVESRRLGLDYCDRITELNISIDALTSDPSGLKPHGYIPEHAEAYRTVLRVAPKINVLCVDMTWYFNIYTSACLRKIYAFFDSIIPLCGRVTGLRFTRDTCIEIVEFMPRFIETFADRLVLFQTDLIYFNDPLLQQALRLCTQMRDVEFANTDINDLADVVPYWPHLRTFRGYHDPEIGDINVDSLVYKLAKFCMHLEEAVLVNDDLATCFDVTDTAMCFLLKHCPNLRHLAVAGHRLTDEFLHVAKTALPQLERLSIKGCPRIWGDVVAGKAWPELKELELEGCGSLEWKFVQGVIDGCPALKAVRLPGHFNEEMAQGFMMPLEFECGAAKEVGRRWWWCSDPLAYRHPVRGSAIWRRS